LNRSGEEGQPAGRVGIGECPSRATAHHLSEIAPTATPAPLLRAGFVHRRISPVAESPPSYSGLPEPVPIALIHLLHGRSLLSLCRCQKQGAQLPLPEYSANFPK